MDKSGQNAQNLEMYWVILLSMVVLVSRPQAQTQSRALPIKSYSPFKTVKQQRQHLLGLAQQLRYFTHTASHSPPDEATVRKTVVPTGQRQKRDLLIWASAKGDEVEAKRLLDLGADVNARDENQRTPLHRARCAAMVKLLLDHGADVNARDVEQQTPLHRARSTAMVKLLLDHGADASVRDIEQRSPLHVAEGEAMVKLLLGQGAPRLHAAALLVLQRVKRSLRWIRASALWRKCRMLAVAVATRIREPIPSEILFRMLTSGIVDEHDGSEAESSNLPPEKQERHGSGWLGALEARVVAEDPRFARRLNEARLARFLQSK